MKRWLAFLLIVAGWTTCARAQGVRYDNVAYGIHGTPFGPATIEVWNGTGTGAATVAAGTAGASEAGLTVTITTTAAHGYGVGQTVAVAGVTNATNGAFYNGIWTITAVPSSTTFQYVATTSGLQPAGYGITATAVSLVYQDKLLSDSLANPFTSDGLGNYGFWAAPGLYIVGVYGPQLTTKTIPVDLSCDPTGTGCGGAAPSSCLAGAPDTQYVSSKTGNNANAGTNWCSAVATEAQAVTNLSATGGNIYEGPEYANAQVTTLPANVHLFRMTQLVPGGPSSAISSAAAERILFPTMGSLTAPTFGKLMNLNGAVLGTAWLDWAVNSVYGNSDLLTGETDTGNYTSTDTQLFSSSILGLATSTQKGQSDGVTGFCDSLGSGVDCTGLYGIATDRASGGGGSTLEAAILSVGPNATETGVWGMVIKADNSVALPANSFGIEMTAVDVGQFNQAFKSDNGFALHGISLGKSSSVGTPASQDLCFVSFSTPQCLWADQNGNLTYATNSAFPLSAALNVATQGVAAVANPAARSASIAATGIFTGSPGQNRMLVLHYYLYQAAAGAGCTGNATVTLSIAWTDPNSTSQSSTSASVAMGNSLAAGDFTQGELTVAEGGATAVNYSTTYTAGTGCTTAPTYSLFLNAM